ncbi:MAG TPA: extracellular solute-binding protein [Polyangia bacterium]|nr:extracellular solute-binding protein [Polyangia bacterium]
MNHPRLPLAAVLAALLAWGAVARADDIVLWHSTRGDEQDALDELVARWNRGHPERRVRALAVPHDAYAGKLTTAIPRGQGPDLFVFAHERIGDWARSGLIRALDGELTAAERTAASPALAYEGRVYGLPLALKSLALFYNRDLVRVPPADTDELVAIAERLRDPVRGTFGLAYEAGSFYFHAPWLLGFGGHVFDEAGRPDLEAPGNARSLEFARSLTSRGLIPKEPTAALVTQLFNDGRAAMVVNGPWFVGEIAPGVRYGVAPLPRVSETGLSAAPFLTVEAAIISSRARDPQAALAFARFLCSREGRALRTERGRQLAVAFGDGEERGAQLPFPLAEFAAQAEVAVVLPGNPVMRSVWEPASRALRAVLRGARTPAEALARAQHELEVVTRPPPEARSPLPYLAGLGALIALGALLALWRWRRPRGARSGRGDGRRALVWLAPAALSLLALVLVPFAVGTAVALFSHRGGEFTFVGLSNFIDILTARDFPVTDPLSFWFTLAVTVLWTAVNVLLHVTIGLALALILRQPWLRLRGVYRVLLIVPWAVPNYITALIWKGMFHSQFGAINGLLDRLGIEPVPWFSGFWTAFAANVTTNTWLGFPFMMVVCLGALQAIPRELEEAAQMDGAGGVTRFFRVILPQIRPALVPAVILGSVWTFNMFNIVYLVSGGEPDGATEILISEAYRWAFSRQEQYGYAAAYAVLIFLAIWGYTLFVRRLGGAAEGS